MFEALYIGIAVGFSDFGTPQSAFYVAQESKKRDSRAHLYYLRPTNGTTPILEHDETSKFALLGGRAPGFAPGFQHKRLRNISSGDFAELRETFEKLSRSRGIPSFPDDFLVVFAQRLNEEGVGRQQARAPPLVHQVQQQLSFLRSQMGGGAGGMGLQVPGNRMSYMPMGGGASPFMGPPSPMPGYGQFPQAMGGQGGRYYNGNQMNDFRYGPNRYRRRRDNSCCNVM